MGHDSSRPELLLAMALAARRKGTERRMLPDRRSGVDRRNSQIVVPSERRSYGERRQDARRKVDRQEGSTLLQKARSRLSGRTGRNEENRNLDHGLR
jgi:hypothetical protein